MKKTAKSFSVVALLGRMSMLLAFGIAFSFLFASDTAVSAGTALTGHFDHFIKVAVIVGDAFGSLTHSPINFGFFL